MFVSFYLVVFLFCRIISRSAKATLSHTDGRWGHLEALEWNLRKEDGWDVVVCFFFGKGLT